MARTQYLQMSENRVCRLHTLFASVWRSPRWAKIARSKRVHSCRFHLKVFRWWGVGTKSFGWAKNWFWTTKVAILHLYTLNLIHASDVEEGGLKLIKRNTLSRGLWVVAPPSRGATTQRKALLSCPLTLGLLEFAFIFFFTTWPFDRRGRACFGLLTNK